jgi:hypothetical protein
VGATRPSLNSGGRGCSRGNTGRWVHSRSLQLYILARCRCHHGDCSTFRSLELGKCHWPLQAALSGSLIKAPGFAGGYLQAPCHQRRHRRRHCRGICRAGDPQPRSANKFDQPSLRAKCWRPGWRQGRRQRAGLAKLSTAKSRPAKKEGRRGCLQGGAKNDPRYQGKV